MEVETREIRAYPTRPQGFVEPLFLEAGDKREIAEHLARSPWLSKASRGCARGRWELVELSKGADGRVEVARREDRRCRRDASRRRVVRVLDRWREISRWWERDGGSDLSSFRVELSGGLVADLALERGSGRWFLVGVAD